MSNPWMENITERKTIRVERGHQQEEPSSPVKVSSLQATRLEPTESTVDCLNCRSYQKLMRACGDVRGLVEAPMTPPCGGVRYQSKGGQS